MSVKLRNWLLLIVITMLVLAADQISKTIVQHNMYLGQSIDVINPFFAITYSENSGASFGFLPQAGDIFLVLAFVIVIGLFIFFPRIPQSAALTRIGIALVCGGALGNAIDRLAHGAVIDFIHYQIPGVISNVSNLADHAIVIGVILILIDSWRSEGKKKEAKLTETTLPVDALEAAEDEQEKPAL